MSQYMTIKQYSTISSVQYNELNKELLLISRIKRNSLMSDID